MAIGKQIRHYRKKAGWTLDKLAEKSDVERGTISALEKRDSASSKFFMQICAAFGLTVEQVADESTDWPLNIPKTQDGAFIPMAREPTKDYLAGFEKHRQKYHLLTPELRAAVDAIFDSYTGDTEEKQSKAANSKD